MHTQTRYRYRRYSQICRLALLVAGAMATYGPAWAENKEADTHSHMSEALRSSVRKLVVIAGPSPTNRDVTGSYEKATPGLVGGVNAGSRIGTVSTQLGGANVNFPIPILTLPGAIIGGISGATKREIQEFRDALTEELAQAKNASLSNEGLALDVYRSLQRVPGLDLNLFASSTPIPDDTDAILYVSIKDLTIEVQGKDAILSTSGALTLRRQSDGKNLYDGVIHYQDTDTLTNWTENDNALWRDYANFAGHYLGREISAEVFDRVELRHELRPKKSGDLSLARKNEWQGSSRSTAPTLAWELILPGDDSYGPWAKAIDESDIYYDIEIYDLHRLVYAEKQVPNSFHQLVFDIDPCKTYRWSVRPSYRVGSDIKYGEWMRQKPESGDDAPRGIVGRKASEAPAYIQDFASLKIHCGRR